MRLMAVYVSSMTDYWIFRREFVVDESCVVAIASVRMLSGFHENCVVDVLYWCGVSLLSFVSYRLRVTA
jgi:hypothetical protein